MEKTYNAQAFETRIYKLWENANAFTPSSEKDAKPFTIIMPPPNANDPLHIGHAMFLTVEDIFIRYHRMKGDATLWLPGADHAGIETQFVFEKKLKKEGKSRFDFDRHTLFQMIWTYVQENKDIAVNQMKAIGASADWSRFCFTLDPKIVTLVLQNFMRLHEKGLIYRDLRLINYCTKCGTGYSELEAKHEERIDPFIYIRYGPFTIGTVRPETKFRDTALAVHAHDPRYKDHIGKTYEIQGLLGPIRMTVISDPDVDPAFGTGIMKVTPAHDPHDFELGKRYKLPITPIIDFSGRMDFSWYINDPSFSTKLKKYQERAKQYHGMPVAKARALIIEHLKEDGLLEKIDTSYKHTVATCYRCGNVLEPLPLPQFFLKVSPLTKKVIHHIKEKKVRIHGPGYDKILLHWLKNLKDWNISRQIVWGIRIPAWYSVRDNPTMRVTFLTKEDALISGEIKDLLQTYSLNEIRTGLQTLSAPVSASYVVSDTSPGEDYLQETDTFDTWFSSGQWPFITLQSLGINDYERFYPTQIMETAYDILIFWVMRMLMLGIELTGTVPFSDVYLHGLVRDEKGQKMSKSKGNVINPMDVIEKYGADALRMALVMSTTAGKDSNTGEDKIRGMRNFTNKIWNAARYIAMQSQQPTANNQLQKKGDKIFQKHVNAIIKTMTKQLDALRPGLAAETVYQEFWYYFCDVAIEEHKKGTISFPALLNGFKTFLKLLHPFVPFVTEGIWQELKDKNESLLITASWPKIANNT